ncbi:MULTISPECIES: DNA adenine methylase [unclassified Psychrobacter]|jgi:DNA adenine methylase|uniref:DNA adenine methylase n=2 Tax=Psychrobacter TaxID=497 RepID=UPI000419E861|nr:MULTISPECIES: DNA adenine methylase [unclassified Psychrobacter]
MAKKNKLVMPFLKWVGGKRQLMTDIEPLLPKRISTYYEPFVGGGAVFLHTQPKKAVINDYNSELINVYETIRDDVDALIEHLATHVNESEYFYQIRALDRQDFFDELSKVERASRVIYLNKTCFNGLYRVNGSGEFNTPFGRYKSPNIINETVLRAVSHYLQKNDIKLLSGDYQDALKNIRKGSFVYFDPPYDPISKSSNFTGYVQGGFGNDEQIRLRDTCMKLNEKGIKFLLSNSATAFMKELYQDFEVIEVGASRHINSVGSKRGEVKEILVRNYE